MMNRVPIKGSPRRCAIYTRKSLQQGLGKDFNTLEAQRAICSAYITSQRHKGWFELAKQYDDGGASGATLDRPQLQELLADIERGLVDVVVVYKIDRLTRTLLDFVRLADFFERYGVVFVSITQNFDTDDSMGRLILNILLTFAQFEREMLSDRLRDRVRACKQAGRWAGGPAPFGYDLMRRRLHVNEAEAAVVRFVFQRYLELENLTAVYRECRAKDVRSKRWRTRAGRWRGGGPITKAGVAHILRNPVYLGEIRHRDETYAGLQAPIVTRDSWDRARAIQLRQARKKQGRNKEHILTDLLFDCFGRPMSVNFRESMRRVFRYYASRQSAWGKRQRLKALRADADELERLVVAGLAQFLSDQEEIRSVLLEEHRHGPALDRTARKCQAAASRLSKLKRDWLRLALRALIERIELTRERVRIVLRCSEVARFVEWDGVGIFKAHIANWASSRTTLLDLPATSARCRRLMHLPIEPGPKVARHPAPGLKRLIHEARQVQAIVDKERDKSLAEMAAQMNYTSARFARVMRLNYLAPDILLAILDGNIPPGLNRKKLVDANLPMDWSLQRRLLGFPDRPQLENGE